MKFRDPSVTQLLVGLHWVGVVGLHDAFRTAEGCGLADREQLVAVMMQELAGKNYLPEHLQDAYRTALWREYLRHRGEDCSPFFSEVPTTIRGEPGEELDRFVATVRSALARSELRPVITFNPAAAPGSPPQLVIGDEVVANGSQSWSGVENAIRQSLSDW